MTINKIDETRLLVSLTDEDLQAYHLKFDQFLWSDSQSRLLIKSLLELAKEETGFAIEDRKLMIEVIPKITGCMVLFTLLDKQRKRTRRVFKIKSTGEPFIYTFETVEDLLAALERLIGIKDHVKESRVLSYGNRYYLLLYTEGRLSPSMSAILSEYGLMKGHGKVAASRLNEYGHIIAKHHAIERIGEYL